MSIFGKILEGLGLKKEEAPKPVASSAPKPANVRPAPELKPAPKPAANVRPAPVAGHNPAVPSTPSFSGMHAPSDAAYNRPPSATAAPMAMVDVVSKLDGLAAANPQKLSWKVSIVDLLKLLGIDSSLQSRKELAVELGCPPEKMGDSAQMNTWLHKTVLQKIAQNGGNVPKDLLD